MRILKKHWKKILLAALCMGVATGAAIARIPPVGSGWQEWTYYNASGTAIGGRLYDCNGQTYRWGTSTGYATMEITNGPCP